MKPELPRAWWYNKPRGPVEIPKLRKKSWLCRLGFHKDRMVHYAGPIACGYTPCKRCGI